MGSGAIGPAPLTDHDRTLIEKCEAAVRDGIALERWCRAGGGDRREFWLDLRRQFRLPNRAVGYFGSIDLNSIQTTVMGCRQTIELGRINRRHDARARLRDFVLGEFLSRAHWVNEDGSPGGFDVERSLYQTPAGAYGKFPERHRRGAMDWRDLGTRFQWVLLTITINDFVMDMGPVTTKIDEAVCVVARPEFVRVEEDPSPECALEISIGYPFIDYAPIPNYFGFGPGKFGAAVKLYTFSLTHDRRIRASMEFAAAPRARKVFDLLGVDPVYDGADLVQWMSLGLFDPAGLHDTMDRSMLVGHCHVHQKLMDGTAAVWDDWLTGITD
jgi:hypothetical protein